MLYRGIGSLSTGYSWKIRRWECYYTSFQMVSKPSTTVQCGLFHFGINGLFHAYCEPDVLPAQNAHLAVFKKDVGCRKTGKLLSLDLLNLPYYAGPFVYGEVALPLHSSLHCAVNTWEGIQYIKNRGTKRTKPNYKKKEQAARMGGGA